LNRRLLTIALAALLAVFGVVAVLAYVRQANDRAVTGLRAEWVLLAKAAIPAGTSLRAAQQQNMLTTEQVPVSSLSTPPVHSVTAANAHLVLTGGVAKGQLILLNMLGPAGTVTASGSFSIPAGKVAVTVEMCVQESVANYVTAGSSVAVFDTYAGPHSQIQRSCDPTHTVINSVAAVNGGADTRIVLTKALVLAVGQNPGAQSTAAGGASTLTDPSSSGSAVQGTVLVTLAVSQADAERLILIDELGLPYMALLGPTSTTTFDNPANVQNLFQP
jgi:pilus assembly protein CpaB